tara:strand:+ start:709 stop:879 length:171 start_codon:yes stop_codon:yes gene_type:complete
LKGLHLFFGISDKLKEGKWELSKSLMVNIANPSEFLQEKGVFTCFWPLYPYNFYGV